MQTAICFGRASHPQGFMVAARLMAFLALLNLALHGAQSNTDPSLGFSVVATPDTALVSWTAASAVPYQLEVSEDLKVWAARGSAIIGTGGRLTVTNATYAVHQEFYRVTRQFPTAKGAPLFNLNTGLLTIVGDDLGRTIVISRDAAGTILATRDGVRLPISGGNPTVANTVLIQVLGGAGDDHIGVDPAASGMPPVHFFGGAGADVLTGGLGSDLLAGGPGNDTLTGLRGSDLLYGEEGEDTFVWNPGDGSDLVEGGAGRDALTFNGANVNEKIQLAANGTRLRFTRDVAAIVLDLGTIETIRFNALGGADSVEVGDLSSTDAREVVVDFSATPGSGIGDGQVDTISVAGTPGPDTIVATELGSSVTVSGLPAKLTLIGAEATDLLVVNAGNGNDTVNLSGLATVFSSRVDGGAGEDVLIGTPRADTLTGGSENDTLTGGRGDDLLIGGSGDDSFTWNPGDGSDAIEGQDGLDTLLFNGANVGENVDLSANGGRLRLFRDVAGVVMDCDGVDRVTFNALGGADHLVINDLSATDITKVTVDLSISPGSGTSDGQFDSVVVNGTPAAETISVSSASGHVLVQNPSLRVEIVGSDSIQDSLVINGLAGADRLDASTLPAGIINLTLNGGSDPDLLLGSQGDDTLVGGQGSDTILGGPGKDVVVWNPGDGSDVVEGQEGEDTLRFNGSNVGEVVSLSANGARLRLSRDVASVVIDAGGVERVEFNALGGADKFNMGDLTGTSVSEVQVDLSAQIGSSVGDGQADTVTVDGTAGQDTVVFVGSAAGVRVTGLVASLTVLASEEASDRLVVNGLGQDDTFEASGLPAGLIGLTLDGGAGADILVGSSGSDILLGGPGDDVLIGGPGVDVLDGGTGSNVVIQ